MGVTLREMIAEMPQAQQEEIARRVERLMLEYGLQVPDDEVEQLTPEDEVLLAGRTVQNL